VSTDLAARYGIASPRTTKSPLAFRFGEFAAGSFRAWGWFLLFSLPALAFAPLAAAAFGGDTVGWQQALAWAPLYIMVGFPLVLLPSSIGALVVWSPFAYLLGFLLRRVGDTRVHLAAFIAFGAGVGAATAAIASVVLDFPASQMFGFVIAAGAAVPLGWRRTARLALANDAAAEASFRKTTPLVED